jgi:hypothetical protein
MISKMRERKGKREKLGLSISPSRKGFHQPLTSQSWLDLPRCGLLTNFMEEESSADS